MPQIRSIEAIMKEVNSIQASREKEINDFMEKRATALAKEQEVSEQAIAAYQNADVKAYHNALDEARTNKDAAQMFLNKAEELKALPCIGKDDYERLSSEVYASLDHYIANAESELRDLIIKLSEAADSLCKEITEGDKILELLQLKLYKDSGVKFLNDGRPVYALSSKREYRNTSLLHFLNSIRREPYFDKLIEQKENE